MTRATNRVFTAKQICPLRWLFISILKLLKCNPVFITATDTVQTAVYQNVTLQTRVWIWQSKREACAGLLPNTVWSSQQAFHSLTSDKSQNLVNVRHTRSSSCSGCHVKKQQPLLAHLHLYYHTSTWGKMDVMPYNAPIQGPRNTIQVFVISE